MPALWTYPWTLAAEGLDRACEGLAARGIDALNVASHYHSVRTMQPRTPDVLFAEQPGGCYFVPDQNRFADTPIDPLPNAVPGMNDPLADVVEAAEIHGLDVNAWTVCLHNSRLGAANPDYRIESAFGDAHDHALCPSHSAVREYYAAVVTEISDRGVEEIQLESVGYQSAFHEHGTRFGHDKRQVLTTAAEEILLSQCFCDGCRAAARDHSVDSGRRTRPRSGNPASVVRRATRRPTDARTHWSREDATLRALFDFRASVVTAFVERLAAATPVPLNYYAMEAHTGVEPGSGWPAGVRLADLADHVDRMTAICYESDPIVARERVRTFRRTVDLPLDAGVTLDPAFVERESDLVALVDAIRDDVDDVFVYHHGLTTEAQLDWVASAFAE